MNCAALSVWLSYWMRSVALGRLARHVEARAAERRIAEQVQHRGDEHDRPDRCSRDRDGIATGADRAASGGVVTIDSRTSWLSVRRACRRVRACCAKKSAKRAARPAGAPVDQAGIRKAGRRLEGLRRAPRRRGRPDRAARRRPPPPRSRRAAARVLMRRRGIEEAAVAVVPVHGRQSRTKRSAVAARWPARCRSARAPSASACGPAASTCAAACVSASRPAAGGRVGGQRDRQRAAARRRCWWP